MQWSQISASEKYKSLTPEQQQKIQDGYFDQFIAPKAQQAGLDPEEARAKFREKAGAVVAMPETPAEDQPGFLSNAARLAGERAGDLAGNLARGIRQTGDYLEEKMPMGGFVFEGGMPRYAGAEEYKAKTAGKPQALDQVADAAENIDLGGESRHNPESVKDQWKQGNYGTAAGEALKFGGESFIQSIPDMAAVVASLPLYVGARATEMGTARAENKGKSEADISDTAEALPFALGSALLERIVPGKMLRSLTGKQVEKVGEEVAKAVIPRIAKEAAKGAGKEALTEMFQEGVLEYVGERYGTDAQMSLAEAIEQGAWASLAGGVGGGAMGGLTGIRAPRQPVAQADEAPQADQGEQSPAAGLEHKPERMITMPDGTTAWESEAEQLRDVGVASRHPGFARAETPIMNQTAQALEQEIGAATPADLSLDDEINALVAEVEGLDRELNPPEAPQILPGALESGAELAQAEQIAQGPQILPGALERPPFNPEPVDATGQSPQEIQSPQELMSERAPAPTEAQQIAPDPAPQAKPKKPAYLRVNPARDELLMAIAKLGGISQEEAKAQGIDPAHFRDRVGWNNPFRKQGKTLDEMAEALAQEGYLPQNYSANELLDKISGSLSGRKNYTPQGVEYWTAKERFDEEALRAMEGDDVELLAQLVDPEIKSTPEAEADPAIKALAHLIDDAIEAGASLSRIQEITRDENLTFNQTAGILVALTHEARRANELQNEEGELAGSDGPRKSDTTIEGVTLTGEESVRFLNELFGITDEEPVLSRYTEQDLTARQQAEQERQKAEQLAQSKAEQDARLSDFTLTGSNRPADLAAARGQNELFGIGATRGSVNKAAAEAATSPLNDLPEPTQAQKEAGNYKKGKTRLHGLEISIENPRGSQRSGTDPDGNPWTVEMRDHYGYIRKTTGADGEQVDVFIGPNPESDKVYVVDQINPNGTFDEHKVVMGYDSKLKARAGYRDNYSEGWKVGPITEMTMDEFKAWLRDGDTSKPVNQDHFRDAGKMISNSKETLTSSPASSSQVILDSSPQSNSSQIAQPAPSNSIAESEVVYSGYERETSSLQVQQSKQRGGHPPAQIDLFAPLRVPSATARTQAKDNFYVLFEQVGTQEFATGIDTVTSARDLAHVVAPLRKHAQESMIAVVTDDQGKILNVIRHTKGQKDSSDVGPVELMAAVASTKGGTRVWLAHNHPSGTTKPSQADRRITAHLDSISETLGIRPMGHVIVAPGSTRAAFFKSDGTVDDQVIIRPSARTKRVELTERVLRKRGKLENISSARDAKRIASNLESEDALILLSNSNDVVGVVNISKDEMKSLKTRGGTRRIFSALDKTNANAVIIKTKDREAAANVSKFLNGFDGELRILDWLQPSDDGSSYISDAEGGSGTIRSSGSFHSKSEKASPAKGVPLDQLQQITADFFDRFPGALDGISVRLFGDEARAFGPNLTERDRGKIKGGFNPATGDLVLIAANLDGAADAQETLQHEILAHHGMGFLSEAQITEVLNTIKKAILEDRQVNKIWQEIEKTYGNKPVADQLEEVLARIAEKLDTGTWARTWNNVLLAIRKALAKLGLIKPLTRLEDLKAIIYDFAKAFEEGKAPGRRGGGERQSRNSGADELAKIRTRLESDGVSLRISERSDSILVSKIVVPQGRRNKGIGTAAMQSLIDYADSKGKRVELSPSSDFGGSKVRLRKFYKRLGFVENKGPNRDYEISETMYREPLRQGGVSRSGVDQTETATFKKWFGDSKVVDDNGKPLVVYHGTSADFTTFRTDNDLGAHFGTREQAATFVEKEGTILPAYLAINNPLRLVDNGDFYPVRVVPQLQKLGILPDAVYPSQFSGESGVRAIQKAIKNAGFDGVVYANQREGEGDSYIAFDPSQIKSATGNTGAFDPTNPDIRFSRTPNSEPRPSAGASVSEDQEYSGRRDGGERQSKAATVDQTETAAFKKWFGDSKVVDENGKPLVVYHGTIHDFTEFDPSTFGSSTDAGTEGQGFYFLSSADAAASNAEWVSNFGEKPGANVMPAYLSIQSPYRVTSSTAPKGLEGDPKASAAFTRDLIRQGYDGVEYTMKSGIRSYVAFRPEQIKSATGNTGAFDPDNPDIRFSRRSDSEPRPSAGVSVSERVKKAIPKTKSQKELEQQRADLHDADRSAFDRLGDKDKTIFQRVRTEIKRQLTPGGLLPKDVFDLKILRDGKMNADEIESRVRIGAFKAAVQKAYGKPYEKLGPAVKARINAALRGENVLVPAAVRDQIGFMRDEIKRLSAIHVQQLMDDIKQLTREAKKQMVKAKEIESESGIDPAKQTGDPDAIREYLDLLGDETKQFSARGKIAEAKKKAALLKTITENFDTYLHRSYRAFDDPNWPKKVPAKVYAEAVDYLAAGYAGDKPVTDDHRDRARKKVAMMLQEGTAFDSMGAFISESKLGAKDLSIIKRRKDIAPEIRALLGEYEDAPVNYTKSVTKMARLVYNHEFLGRMMEIGKAQGFLLEKQNLDLKATKKIAGDASEVYAPLNGLYTYPEFDQALKDALGKENMADWYRAIVAVNGAVKFGKTVLSPTTAMRNFYSAMFFSLANGHFDMAQMRKSLGILKTYFRDADDGGKEYMKKLRTLGVIYDSPYASEMMEQLKDSKLEDVDQWWNPIAKLKAPIDFAQRFYSYGDDFWKIIGFENEKALLMKHKGMTEQKAEKEAAERIRNTYPTYSMTGRFVNSLRRFPLAGTFVSFPAEIVRTSYHITRYMAQDLKDSRAMGMQKLAGYAIAGGAIAGMSALSKAWFNVEDDEEDALKTLAPEWQKNSNFLYWGRDEKGQLRYMDLSFLDPYNYWKRPINAFMRDQDPGEAAVDGTLEMLKPFFGQDILFGAITEAITNKKQTGARVFNPEDDATNQILDISKHLGKAVQPGFASNIGRMWDASQGTITSSGKQYKVGEELAALAGFRMGTFDPKTALYYQTFGFQDRKRSASMLLTSAMRDPNEKTDDDLRDAYERAMTARDRAFRDMLKVVGAAKKAGMTEMQIRVTLRNSGVSKADSAWLARGEAPPWKPSSAMMRGAIKKAAVLFDEETADEFRRRENFIKQLNRDAQK